MPGHPFIPFTDCAEVVVQGDNGGTAAYLTFGAKFNTAFALTDQQALADNVATWASATLLPNLHAGYNIEQVKVTDLNTVSSPVVFSTATLPATGSVGGNALTNQNAAVVSFKTALRGRSFRGRNYVTGVPPSALASTTLYSGTFIAALEAAYGTLITGMAAIGWTFVVLSRFSGNAPRVTGVATPVTSLLVRAPIGTQRRRVIGHGI